MSQLPAFLLPLFLTLATVFDGWLGVFLDTTEHAQVLEVIPDSPAAKAGLQAGDRLLSVDDVATPTRDAFMAAVQAGKPGQRVRLKVQRDGKDLAVVVRLGERPPEDEIPPPSATGAAPAPTQPKVVERSSGRGEVPAPVAEVATKAPVVAQDGGSPFLGVGLMEADGGLQVTEVVPASPAATAGIEVDDVLVQFGKAAIKTMADLEAALGKAKPGQQVELQLRHDAGRKSVVVTLGSKPAARASGGLVPRPVPKPEPAMTAPAAPTVAASDDRGWLGINSVDNDVLGVGVGGMVAGGPVEKAGLQIGDRIIGIDGNDIRGAGELMEFLGKTKAGQVVTLDVARGDQKITQKVTLGTRPAATVAAPVPAAPTRPAPAAPVAPAAPLVVPAPAEQRGWLGVNLQDADEGILIASVAPDRAAAKGGLEAGDRIVSFDGDELADLEELQAFLAKSKPGQVVSVGLERDGEKLTKKVALGTRDPAVPVPPAPAEAGRPVRAPESRGREPKPVEAASTEPAALPKAFGTDLARAERRANRANKPLLALVGTMADGACQAQVRAFGDRQVAELLSGFECVFVDAEQNDRFVEHQQVRELPTLLVLQGGEVARHAGLLPVDKLGEFLRQRRPLAASSAEPRPDSRPAPRPAVAPSPAANDLQAEVEALRKELAELRRALEELRRQRGGRE